MTRLVMTDAAFNDIGKVPSFTMEMAFGDDENDYSLSVPYYVELAKDSVVYVPETEWGGLVREPTIKKEGGYTYRVYEGPTWHGLLSQRVLRPDSGQDYLTANGNVANVVNSLVTRCRLGTIFEAGDCPDVNVSYQFDRYCTLYEGLRKMLAAHGLILRISRPTIGKTKLNVEQKRGYIDDGKSSKYGFMVKKCHPVNHIVALGKGELHERQVVDVYADVYGNVSQTQSIFGVDEIEESYDDRNAEPDDLLDDAVKRLSELQELSQVELEIPDDGDYLIDDEVGVSDSKTGVSVRANIKKIIVECSDVGRAQVTYETTDADIESM